ncbi:alpha/beta fold hydrolase [Sinosporangium album]|uniref:alpha/beta fold hydrolase n=1 Tax=Sinosporangium album TaxID=504805 RepID=UPI001C408F60|nr:alpha/beta fold hydrolase [Sinosporangium album]
MGAAGYPASATAGASAAPVSKPAWTACEGGVSPEMQCAKLEVPVDWDAPTGKTITLSLARAPKAGSGKSAGTVIFHPGGPGAAGIPVVSRALANFADLRKHMDVVTWNPRGGQSGEHLPMESCARGPVVATPDDRREYEELLKVNSAGIAACRNADPQVFDNLDSATQARDMDAIRAALGEEKLTYLGNSYGGVVGATYARMFPKRVRAMALDSVPNHVVPVAASERLQYQALERIFDRFAKWCTRSADCVLSGKNVEKIWQDVVRRADRDPLPGAQAAGDRRYDGVDLKVLAYSLILRERSWPALAAAVQKAADGSASGFDPQGRGLMEQAGALLAVRCADGYRYNTHRAYRTAVRRAAKVSPNFAGMREVAYLACSPWAAEAVNPPASLRGRDLPPMLGISPADEFASVDAITGQVPGSVTVRYEGVGHGLYVNHGDPCTIVHVNRYLIEGRLPAAGTACPARPA